MPYKKFEQKQLRTLQQCSTVVPNIYSPTDTVFIKVRREGEESRIEIKKRYTNNLQSASATTTFSGENGKI
jgi:hypothetical protein